MPADCKSAGTGMVMKKLLQLALLLVLSQPIMAQEWVVPVEADWNFCFNDMVSVDGGESVIGIGRIRSEDGYIAKASKNGDYSCRETHLPGMMLSYFTAVQLGNGNYMVFGVCDDSLCDPFIQKHLRVDVFDGQLECVSSKMYDVDDDVFDCFYHPWDGYIMRCIVSKAGTVILASRLSYYEETNWGNHYRGAVRFYEFDDWGDIIRIVDNPIELAEVGSIKEITYEPHSDNLMMVVKGGNYGYDFGSPGIFVVDPDMNIIAHQSMLRLGGADVISNNACEGKWFDGDHILLDCQQYIGSYFSFQTLYIVDSALHVYANLPLPPYDSCTISPYGTSTSYINDTTIFAFSFSGSGLLYHGDVMQVNVTLVDKQLNLLGRKVIKIDDVICYTSSPAAFNDGGCCVLFSSYNGNYYPGEPFYKFYLMKFRREDIEITWDVVQETEENLVTQAYPNPTTGILNIPIGETNCQDARLQIFDMKGGIWLDSALDKQGNLITVDTHTLDAGLYVYKLLDGNREVANGKFVKE